MYEAQFNHLILYICNCKHTHTHFVEALFDRACIEIVSSCVSNCYATNLSKSSISCGKKSNRKELFNERFRKIVDICCTTFKEMDHIQCSKVQSKKTLENKHWKLFSMLRIVWCLHSSQIQKSTSIYNGLSAEPEMVVSLSVCVVYMLCVCVHVFVVRGKLSIRPILWMQEDHSDTEEMLLCSNFPWI